VSEQTCCRLKGVARVIEDYWSAKATAQPRPSAKRRRPKVRRRRGRAAMCNTRGDASRELSARAWSRRQLCLPGAPAWPIPCRNHPLLLRAMWGSPTEARVFLPIRDWGRLDPQLAHRPREGFHPTIWGCVASPRYEPHREQSAIRRRFAKIMRRPSGSSLSSSSGMIVLSDPDRVRTY
jgi:hypothetical protein